MIIKIDQIKINERLRDVNAIKVAEIASSIKEIGLLNNITISKNNELIAGMHRLEAYKSLGRTEIECNVIDVSGIKQELAEIDENLIRNDLHFIDRGTFLSRRKEIYEELYPETKAGEFKGNQFKEVKVENTPTTPSFVSDTAEKLGESESKIKQEIQIAKAFTPEMKAQVKAADITKKDTLELARLTPEKQKQVMEKVIAQKETPKEAIKEILKEEKAEKKETKLAEIKAAAKEIPTPIGGDYQYKIGDCMEYFKTVQDKSVKLFLTDIPYGEVSRESNGLRNLDRGIADIVTFNLDLFLKEAMRVTNGSIYIFCGLNQSSQIRKTLDENNMSTRLCIWEKTNPTVLNGDSLWLSGIECCIYGKFANAPFNEHCKNTVWKFPITANQIHPTQKPLELMKYLIKVSSNEGDIVLDPCMGSGVVLKASKELKRKFNGCELSPEWEYNYKNIINGVQ